MDIAGIIGEGAWAVVKNILTLVVFAPDSRLRHLGIQGQETTR